MKADRKAICRPHWSQHLVEIRAQLGSFSRVLVASDFDGTLSPIVEHAADAALEPTAGAVLLDLAKFFPRVQLAFLSGRGLVDLASRLEPVVENAILAGNHGLEIRGGGLDWSHPDLNVSRPQLDLLAIQLHRFSSSIPGLEIEDKGASVTLHYRRTPETHLPAIFTMISSIELPAGVRIHEGKKVYEFRPRVEWNKGFAMRKIAVHLGIPDEAIVFLGDDVTDEDAFRELDHEAVTVHIGKSSDISSARYDAVDPRDVVQFLSAISEAFTERE